MTAHVNVGMRIISPPSHAYTLNAGLGVIALSGKPVADVSSKSFPRMYGWYTSSQSQYSLLSTMQRFAKFDYALLGNSYVGGGAQMYGGSMQSGLNAIRAASLVGTKVGLYFINDTMEQPTPNYPALFTILNNNNWWLYKSGSAGTKTPNYYNASYWMTNATTYVPAVSGLYVEDTCTQYKYNYHVTGGNNDSANFDFLGHDNFYLRTPTGGYSSINATYQSDWNRDGTGDYQTQVGPPSGATIDQAYRTGMARSATWLQANTSVQFHANVTAWGDNTQITASGNVAGGTTTTGMANLVQGGVMEGQFGISWGVESRLGFAQSMTIAQFVTNAVVAGAPIAFGCYFDSNGRDYVNQSQNWVAARYQFCATLQTDKYYWPAHLTSYTSQTYDITAVTWIDEWSVNAGTNTATGEAGWTNGYKYLGQSLDAEYTVLGNGVYARRYTNGGDTWCVFCNPRGNGSQTFNITTYYPGKQFRKINGGQDAAWNSGATVASLTLPDRTGIIGRLV